MENTLDISAQVPWLETFVFVLSVAFIFAVFRYIVLNNGDESPVTFKVPVPEQCLPQWKGEVVDEPSVKVSLISAPKPAEKD